MKTHYVVAEYRSLELARVGLEVLEKQGLGPEDVSLVTRSDDPELATIVHQRDESETATDTAKGAGVGAALGGGIALPLAAGTMVAPFFVAGPLAAAIVGAAAGAAVGGTAQPDERTKSYRQRVEAGSTLVIASGDKYLVNEAEAGLKTTHFANIDTFDVEEEDEDEDE